MSHNKQKTTNNAQYMTNKDQTQKLTLCVAQVSLKRL